MRTCFFSALVAIALSTVGCADPWTLVHQVNPTPYGKSSNMTIEELSFDDVKVGEKTEDQYLATKSADTQQSFRGDKDAMVAQFRKGFDAERGALPIIPAGLPGSNPFVIKPRVTFIEPGFFSGMIVSASTELRVTIDVVDANGNMDDEIVISTKVSATMDDPASGTRMREAAQEVGRDTAAYLKKRLGV